LCIIVADMRVKIVSGGQTGVDRAALDVALQLDLDCGGWCPKGRRAEDGRIGAHYPLRETPSTDYAQRTEWNVRDSDATLVLTRGSPTEGTALTVQLAATLRKRCLIVDLAREPDVRQAAEWIARYQIRRLNIAGPRETKCPGIHAQAVVYLSRLIKVVLEPFEGMPPPK
jgi:hypothetical protein